MTYVSVRAVLAVVAVVGRRSSSGGAGLGSSGGRRALLEDGAGEGRGGEEGQGGEDGGGLHFDLELLGREEVWSELVLGNGVWWFCGSSR